MSGLATQELLTDRWMKLKYHRVQDMLWHSKARFRVVPAGRRSGKTEFSKRFLIKSAVTCTRDDGWFVFGAPTHSQARRIYWADIKRMVPKWMIERYVETDMTIRLVTGTEITVLGMDQPERVEGRPLDGIILDEYADMKPMVWDKHVRPALDTVNREGWAWFVGTPEGRDHYYKLYMLACGCKDGTWESFTWKSSDILSASAIEQAKKDLDTLTYQQEYEAAFVNFEGRAYYPFSREIHTAKTKYNPNLPLVFCFDFNVKPGVAVVCQEQMYTGPRKDVCKTDTITVVIGEVWIKSNSNTPRVCNKLVQDWGDHQGDIFCYGDATGGSKGTAKVAGSDWDLVRATLEPEFENRLYMRYRRRNPFERPRINAVNSRLCAADQTIHMLVDPAKAPHVCNDLEGVSLLEGGSGEIDEKADEELNHISSALGYYIEKVYPAGGRSASHSTEVS